MSETAVRRGIPTTYRHGTFRSRLEARWAAFFDAVDWSWIYEPFDADQWIPDFLITGSAPFLIEVGPCVLPNEFRDKAAKPLAAFPPGPGFVPERSTLVLGVGPLALDGDQAGFLTSDLHWSGPAFARWAQCRQCGLLGIYHEEGSYLLRPCGHHDGDHHLGPVRERDLFELWAVAGNAVQWRPPRPRRPA